MDSIRTRVANWSASLPSKLDVGSLYNRCPVAHKWKATFRVILTRESSLWRMADLGSSFVHLVDHGDILASRIILRSACETSALLAYLNKKIIDLLDGKTDFTSFNDITKQLLLGGKNSGDYYSPVNVMTAIGHFSKNVPAIRHIYDRLSEDAHPNASGMIYSYSSSDPETLETVFSKDRVSSSTTVEHTVAAADLIFLCYEQQYNEIWPQKFEALEQWLRDNDSTLVASGPGA